MTRIIFFLCSYFYLFSAHAFEPSSGLVCKNLKSNYSVEFLFKKNNKTKIVKAFKRIDGQFIEIGNVVGKKLSSFIIFEDKTVLQHLDFAWHLDEVTKNLNPFLLNNFVNKNIKMPIGLSCISKNFWY